MSETPAKPLTVKETQSTPTIQSVKTKAEAATVCGFNQIVLITSNSGSVSWSLRSAAASEPRNYITLKPLVGLAFSSCFCYFILPNGIQDPGFWYTTN